MLTAATLLIASAAPAPPDPDEVRLLPWMIGLIITVGGSLIFHLLAAVWFASKLKTRLDATIRDVEQLDTRVDARLGSITDELKGLRIDLMKAMQEQANRVSRIEGRLERR